MMTPLLACVASRERMPHGSGCDQNAEQRIQESGNSKIKVRCLDTKRSTAWDERKCRSSVLLACRPPAFIEEPWESQGEEEKGGVEKQPEAWSGGEGAEREDTKWADKRFKGEGCISRGEARLNSGGIQAGRVQGESHSVCRCGISWRSRNAAGGSSRSESSQEFWT